MLHRFTLQQVLTATLLALVGGTALAVGAVMLDAGRRSVALLADDLRAQVESEIRHYLRDLVATPRSLATEAARLASDEIIPTDSHDALLRYLRFQLMDEPSLRAAGVGLTNGRVTTVARENGVLVARVADAGDRGTITTHRMLPDGSLGERLHVDAFDVLSRPWFELGMAQDGVSWTRPYLNFLGDRVLLNASHPLRTDGAARPFGVVSVSLALQDLAEFLASLEAAGRSLIFVADADGTILASTDGGATLPGLQGQAAADTARVDETLAALQARLGPLGEIQGRTSTALRLADGSRHRVDISTFTDGFGLDWRLVISVPRTAYVATIDDRMRLSIGIALLGLCVSLSAAMLLARRLTQPLARVSQAARLIAQGDGQPGALTLPVTTRGGSREVSELSQALGQMTQRLRGSFQRLQEMTDALRRSEGQLRQVMETMPVGVVVHDAQRLPQFLNRVAKRLLGLDGHPLTPDALAQRHTLPEGVAAALERIETRLVRAALDGEVAHVENLEIPRGKLAMPLEGWSSPVRDDDGHVLYAVSVLQDVSQRRRAESRLIHHATHDSLTGLANRTQLVTRLDLAIHRRRRESRRQYALLFLDLDHFKVVNDSLGHLVGDQVLIEVARRLSTLTRDTDLAARLGGDEFVLLVEDLQDQTPPISIAERIFETLAPPIEVRGRQVRVGTSIGVVYGDELYEDAADLLRDADIALYRAKAGGRGRLQVFDASMREQVMRRQRLEDALRDAIHRNALAVWFQPIVSLRTDRVTGLEALCRWDHPELGTISPTEFVKLAEESSLIVELNAWVLRTACRTAAQWLEDGTITRLPRIHVNLSSEDIAHGGIVPFIDETLEALALPATCLGVELTEGVMVNDIEQTRTTLQALRERGIAISIDDFGTGYSSLSYLYTLPVDALKIDKAFVSALRPGATNFKIVSAVLALSNELGIDAIAEGVETEEEFDLLRQMGCELAQGFLVSRPLPAAQMLEFLRRAEAHGGRAPPAQKQGAARP